MLLAKKRKKNSRQRGSTWHGWGRGQAHHKSAGNKGGRGNAGTGKRADTKKPSIWTTDYFGSKGFVRPRSEKIRGINIGYLEDRYHTLTREGIIRLDKGHSVIDLSELKVKKLLSTGNPSRKYRITVKYASQNAIEKIQAKGGEVILTGKKKGEAKDAELESNEETEKDINK